MAEYLIQSKTLDDIADAINAKTGGSEAMTPAEMVTAIGSISGGGSALLAQYAASEPVHAARIDFTSDMQGYDEYFILCEGTPNRIEYLCPAVNSEPDVNIFGDRMNANTPFKVVFGIQNFIVPDRLFLTRFYSQVSGKEIEPPVSYFKVAGYYADSLFSNFKISVYGVKFQ